MVEQPIRCHEEMAAHCPFYVLRVVDEVGGLNVCRGGGTMPKIPRGVIFPFTTVPR